MSETLVVAPPLRMSARRASAAAAAAAEADVRMSVPEAGWIVCDGLVAGITGIDGDRLCLLVSSAGGGG